MRRTLALLCCLGFIATACGSTAGEARNRGEGLTSGPEAAHNNAASDPADGAGTPRNHSGGTQADGSAVGRGIVSGAGGRDSEVGTSLGLVGEGPTSAAQVPVGKGVTADRITLGIGWIDVQALAATGRAMFGSEGEAYANTTRELAQLVVDHLNANGGIAGREIIPVYHEYKVPDVLNKDSRRRAEQEMCADFTEDHTVFAMIPLVSNEGVMTACAVNTDTPMVSVTNLEDSVDEQRFGEIGPWWYRPGWLSAERRERALVDRLVAQRFFGRQAKVGILVEDRPVYRRGVDNALKPALARAGVEVVSEIAYPDIIDSPWVNYVLQMRQAGVTHVVWSHCGCGAAGQGLFMRASEDQGWRPKNAIGTDMWPGSLAGIAPAEQLRNTRGIGWQPTYDGTFIYHDAITPTDQLCRDITRAAEQAEGGAHIYCEGLFFLQAALDRAPALTSQGLLTGAEALGDRYVPATTPAARFGAGRHDGTAAVWDLAYDAECECFVYLGEAHGIG